MQLQLSLLYRGKLTAHVQGTGWLWLHLVVGFGVTNRRNWNSEDARSVGSGFGDFAQGTVKRIENLTHSSLFRRNELTQGNGRRKQEVVFRHF